MALGARFAFAKGIELGRMPIARKHHLLALGTQMLNQNGKALLRTDAIFQKLDIVQKQHITVFVLFLEGISEFADITDLPYTKSGFRAGSPGFSATDLQASQAVKLQSPSIKFSKV